MLQGFSYSALKKILSMRPWLCLLCHRPLHPAADLGISAVPPGIGNLRKLEGLQMEGCPLAEPLASLYRSVPLLLVQVHNPALTSLDLSGLGLAEVSRACACAHGGGCGRACVHTRACVYTLTRDGREGLRHGCRRGHVGKRGACQKGTYPSHMNTHNTHTTPPLCRPSPPPSHSPVRLQVPGQVFRLSGLTALDLSRNALTRPPPELGLMLPPLGPLLQLNVRGNPLASPYAEVVAGHGDMALAELMDPRATRAELSGCGLAALPQVGQWVPTGGGIACYSM